MACAITAQKQHVPVAHVEGGIRSGDWRMPEEINRLVTDSISNYFYTTSSFANDNLLQSGVTEERIQFVGNTMIDTLMFHLPHLIAPPLFEQLKLDQKPYFVITLHRPSNVDDETMLVSILNEILANTQDYPVIFPVHPRTAAVLNRVQFSHERLHLVPPMSYLEFIFLVSKSFAVITDSGGITEETTVLGIPCMTLRDSTERQETVTLGTNELIGTDVRAISPTLSKLFSGNWKKGAIPPLWDGKAAQRIVEHILTL
jgi:UDP-N-acetylglucosamine 2-epimerase (non-hydrolysing)